MFKLSQKSRKSFALFSIAAALISCLAVQNAFAHARWKLGSTFSAPRDEASGHKVAPCGGAKRTANVKNYSSGQTVQLEFEETINHLGYYEVYLLGPNDERMQGVPAPLARLDDKQNDAIVDGASHQYTISFKVPAVTCTECAFQLIQVMLDNPNAPSNYYSCTDVTIGNAAPNKPSGFKVEKRP
ncbi:hypothetical protein EBU99_12120 [bacterium]|nr:hypothetical protein [bacterium]